MSHGFRDGLRSSLPLAVSTGLLGITFGATALASGWPPAAPIVASIVIFSGSAQFALLTVLASGGGLATAVGSAALFNARFVPMGIALAPSCAVGGAARRGGTDERRRFLGDRARWRGSLRPPQAVRRHGHAVRGVARGHRGRGRRCTAAERLPRLRSGRDLPAFFLVLLLEELREGGGSWRVALASAALAAALLWVVSPGVTSCSARRSRWRGCVADALDRDRPGRSRLLRVEGRRCRAGPARVARARQACRRAAGARAAGRPRRGRRDRPEVGGLSAELIAGLVVAAGVWWRWRSPVVAVVAAAAATAPPRAL